MIILQNILSNAVKYSEKGSIIFEASTHEKDYGISVSDNGIGMSATAIANIEKIKTGKLHLSATNFNPDTSSNLGYYIIADFLQLLGGNIDVQSTIGIGTIVKITLPVRIQ